MQKMHLLIMLQLCLIKQYMRTNIISQNEKHWLIYELMECMGYWVNIYKSDVR